MTLAIIWAPSAELALRSMHWRTASKIDGAVIALAEHGTGDLVRREDGRYRLRTATHDVILRIDTSAGELHVLGVFAR